MKFIVEISPVEASDVIQERIDEARNLNDQDTFELAKITAGGLLLPGNETFLKNAIAMRKDYAERLKAQWRIVNASEGDITVEFEV